MWLPVRNGVEEHDGYLTLSQDAFLLLRTCNDPVGWLFVSPGYCELTANDRATRP
jgi:hypothetical protein